MGGGGGTAPPSAVAALRAERLAAAAGAARVGVLDLEPRLLERVDVVEHRAGQVDGALVVDDHAHRAGGELVVVVGDPVVEAELVLEPGAAASDHLEAQAMGLELAVAVQERLDAVPGGGGDLDEGHDGSS